MPPKRIMFKRSSSKEKKASSSMSRPQYINAAMRNTNAAAGVPVTKSLAHTSVLEISDSHAKILSDIAATGRIPTTVPKGGASPSVKSPRTSTPSSPTSGAALSWEIVRDEVYKPLIEKLLAISLACRSDVNLPNGRWIGAGTPPSGFGDNNGTANGNGSSASQSRGVGTPSTAPNTPIGGDASVFGAGGKKKSTSDSDSDNDNANSFKRSVTDTTTPTNHNNSTSVTDIVPSVLDKSDFEAENEYILDQWCSLPAPTFTIQRLAEILLQHRRFHCYAPELPFGPAAIVGTDGTTVSALRSTTTGGKSASRSATPNRSDSLKADSTTIPRSPRSQGVLRGEKLQASIRRCVLVASLEGL